MSKNHINFFERVDTYFTQFRNHLEVKLASFFSRYSYRARNTCPGIFKQQTNGVRVQLFYSDCSIIIILIVLMLVRKYRSCCQYFPKTKFSYLVVKLSFILKAFSYGKYDYIIPISYHF